MIFLNLLAWALFIAIAWLFRISYIGWLGPYLFALVIGLPILLFLVSLPGMLSLQLSLLAPSRVMRESKSAFTLQFTNPRLLPIRTVTVHLELRNRYNGEVWKQNFVFRNVETSTGSIPVPTELCGAVSCRILRFEVRDALGMFSLRRKSSAEAVCVVMPPAVEPAVIPNFEAALSTANVLKPKYGGGFAEEHDLRAYRPGDTANSVHWKLSSKMDDLIVREALVPENSTVFVVLSRVGEKDRGLELLRWLSGKLLQLEEPHCIVADSLYSVESETASDDAVASLLCWPMREPCGFDRKNARCVFVISGGEVRVS